MRFTPTRVGTMHHARRGAEDDVRFTPTRVGTIHTLFAKQSNGAVHPHACGDDAQRGRNLPAYYRFTPTRVGTINSTRWSQFATRGSPPRVWGRWVSHNGAPSVPTVHPHACGDDDIISAANRAMMRFTPTRVGTILESFLVFSSTQLNLSCRELVLLHPQ